MYLSRIVLDLRHPSVRQALHDCNDMHRNLMQGFAGVQEAVCARNSASVLYRLIEKREEVSLLVSSDIAPDRRILTQRGYLLSPDSPKDVSALESVFTVGRELRFELQASPCKKIAGDAKNSRRVYLREEKQRMEWLIRKADQCGFDVLEALEGGKPASINGMKGGMRIHFDAVQFTGALRIKNSECFWQAYRTGIGPGKAYGLGMLTVASI